MAIQLELAQTILLESVAVLPPEQVTLDKCWQRVLAEAIVADSDFPPFERSPLDGYAVVAAEVQHASLEEPVVLGVVENIPAGSMPSETIRPGTAARIMTGAPIPTGATGVVRLEDTMAEGDQVTILSGAGVARNICRQGEEVACGEEVIPAGTVCSAGAMGMLALLGHSQPWVYQRPRVALIATGSEVVSVDAPLVPGAIRNSNSYMLSGQVAEAGAEPLLSGIVRDDVAEIASCIKNAQGCDLIISIGGVSAGDYDLMSDVYEALGITVLFARVGIKPGMPVLAGVKDGRLYIGLSGNPSAAAIAFEQLVRPMLLKMAGRTQWWRPKVRATLGAAFAKSSGSKRFVWASCWQQGTLLVAKPLGRQGNGMLKSAIVANALIMIPENSPPLAAGSDVEVILLGSL